MKILFLGGGNMASALIGGMCERGFGAGNITVIEPDASARERLQSNYGLVALTCPDAGVFGSDVLVLAVKPQQMKAALAAFAGALQEKTLVISVAAGLRLVDIGRWLGGSGVPHSKLVRCMPNTPALVGAGVTGMFAAPEVDAAGRELAERILAAVGSVVWVDAEEQLDAVTGISGSGPAYVFHFIEALEAAGLGQGLHPESARCLAIGTVLGAARLAEASKDAPSTLREKVTSKGGTTAAALAHLAATGWHDALVGAVDAACARSRELGEQLGQG
ncbi:MAG: pyrroline-5-carboxylate reductase [Azoarcus sp.]|jgi:pyrroline-5-carboxylate reductase|nr:pyrroline-5-carboxylate reductase [Azoarcus sp.]